MVMTRESNGRMKPPVPVKVAERIISDVNDAVKLDHTLAHEPLRQGLRVPDDEYIWPRAERIAGKALRDILGEQIEEQCRLGLEHAHETALAQAASCVDARADLDAHGADSWIAGAVLHVLAFETAWDVFGANPEFGVESIPLASGEGDDEKNVESASS